MNKVHINNLTLNVFPNVDAPYFLAEIAKLQVKIEKLQSENERLRKEIHKKEFPSQNREG